MYEDDSINQSIKYCLYLCKGGRLYPRKTETKISKLFVDLLSRQRQLENNAAQLSTFSKSRENDMGRFLKLLTP